MPSNTTKEPVLFPSDKGVGSPPRFANGDSGVWHMSHLIEREVQRQLLAVPAVHFDSLVVRLVPQGVCLQGVMHVQSGASDTPDIAAIARRAAGVDHVLNQLVITDSTANLVASD